MKAFLCACVVGFGILHLSQGQSSPPLTETPVTLPITTPFNSWSYGANDSDITQPPLAMTVGLNDPEQIHLALGAAGEMYVSWVTGVYVQSATPPVTPTPTVQTQVKYGLSPGNLNLLATGQVVYYTTNNTGYTNFTSNNYVLSPTIHHVLLQGLLPSTIYYYKVGDVNVSLSATLSFKTPQPTGFSSFPQRMGIIADLGQTPNSTVTLQHLVANDPQYAVIIGDLTYSDDYTADQLPNRFYTGAYLGQVIQPTLNPIATSYQPRWDSWGRLMQAVGNSGSIPYMTIEGNHELENKNVKNNPTPFASWIARQRTPYQQSNSTTPLYYSWNLAGVHIIMIGAYELQPQPAPYTSTNMLISDTQIAWIKADLAAVDRSVTPWIVAMFHPPWYNTWPSHFKEVECFQQQVEPILYAAGVDMVYTGHTHAYERTNRVYQYNLDPCGPTHILLGDGGNIEGTQTQTIDQAYNTTATCLTPPTSGPPLCPTLQNGLYCPKSQPARSAYREASFGHGILNFLSPTTAIFEWHRNQDGIDVITDSFTFVRNTTCPNQSKFPVQTTSPPATTSSPVTTSTPKTSVPPATTSTPATTSPPKTSASPATSLAPPATSASPATTSPPATTSAPKTSSSPTTLPAPTQTPPAVVSPIQDLINKINSIPAGIDNTVSSVHDAVGK